MVRYISALAALWLVLALVLAGCRETRFLPGQDLALPDAGEVLSAGQDRLEPSNNAGEAVLSGSVTLSGLTVLNQDGSPAPPAQALTKVLARLVDPEDDILSLTNPDSGGSFKFLISKQLPSGKLKLSVRVLEDLDGDGKGKDTLEQVLPVSLSPGREATVHIELSPAGADVIGTLPPVGIVLLVRLTQLDASGATSLLYATFCANGTVLADRDQDGRLEPGDDYSATDANLNGWPDASEDSYAEPAPGGSELVFESLSGQVEAVTIETQALVLRLDNGEQRSVLVDPFVSIEPYAPVATPGTGPQSGGDGTTDPSYDFLGALPFDASLVGHRVVINGYSAADGFHAQWIVVLDIV